MALTPSNMLPLGTPLPQFKLFEPLTGEWRNSSDFTKDQVTVVMFICNHCPFVKHIRSHLAGFAKAYESKGVAFVAINSNDVKNYPDDHPDKMKAEAKDAGYSFPYLFDETQEVAKSFQAACTPDFYVFNSLQKLAYRGQYDESRPSNGIPLSGSDLGGAIDTLLAGKTPSPEQKPSIGCNIKWIK